MFTGKGGVGTTTAAGTGRPATRIVAGTGS